MNAFSSNTDVQNNVRFLHGTATYEFLCLLIRDEVYILEVECLIITFLGGNQSLLLHGGVSLNIPLWFVPLEVDGSDQFTSSDGRTLLYVVSNISNVVHIFEG